MCIATLAISMGLSYAIALAGPTNTPPTAGNPNLPITTTAIPQYIQGSLILGASQSIFQKMCPPSSICPAPTLDVEGLTEVGMNSNIPSEVQVNGSAVFINEPNYNPFYYTVSNPIYKGQAPNTILPTLSIINDPASTTPSELSSPGTLKTTAISGFEQLCADSTGKIELQSLALNGICN